MSKEIDYIESQLSNLKSLNAFEKFDFLISSVNILLNKLMVTANWSNTALVKEVLRAMEALRYEFGYNKAIESISGRLDNILAYEALRLARFIYSGKDLIKYLNSVLYYEINEAEKENLREEIKKLESA